MAFNKTWDEDEPTDSTLGKDIDNVTRALKEALRERLQQEHAFYEDESTHDDVGEHKKGSARIDFGLQADRPSVNPDNPGSMYVETDTLSVFYDNGSNWINLMQVNFEAIDDHATLTQNIHGVGSSDVESASGAQSKVDTHEDKSNPHSGSASTNHDNAQHSTNYTTLTEVNNNADVPNADHADNADSANSADSADDADGLQGITFKGAITGSVDVNAGSSNSVNISSQEGTDTFEVFVAFKPSNNDAEIRYTIEYESDTVGSRTKVNFYNDGSADTTVQYTIFGKE